MSNHKTPLTELERKGLVAHGLGRYVGKPNQLADVFRQGVAWALLKQDKPDAREMREMLRAMQAGEMTVSRGLELLDMWLAGNYSDDQLPPVGEVLPGERYERVSGKWDGDFSQFKTCCRCTSLRDWVKAHVPCFCWAHGNIREDALETARAYAHEAPGLLFGAYRREVLIKQHRRT